MDPIVESYEHSREEDRLTTNQARKVEFITTIRAFSELFPAKAKVLDCAAGTGAYSFYLAKRGYEVTATDLTPRHIEFIRQELKAKPYQMATAVQDATDLSGFEDESFDIVLCMGPLYHLTQQPLREKCLSECVWVTKSGGYVAVAYISRFAVIPYVATSDVTYLKPELIDRIIKTGELHHDDADCFWTDTYYATPDEMERNIQALGLSVVDHFAQDGIAPLLRHFVDALDEKQFRLWCEYHYSVCREKSTLGASNHGLIIGRK